MFLFTEMDQISWTYLFFRHLYTASAKGKAQLRSMLSADTIRRVNIS
jgi:hypothetical protein